jgi:hypothetical protein
VFPDELSINLIYGTSFGPGQIDFDYIGGNAAIVILFFLSIGAGFAIKIRQVLNRQAQKI